MKTLVLGLKNIVWGIGSCTPNYRNNNAAINGNSTTTANKSSVEESLIFTSLQKNVLRCFSIYAQGPNPYPQEEKDVSVMNYKLKVTIVIDFRSFCCSIHVGGCQNISRRIQCSNAVLV